MMKKIIGLVLLALSLGGAAVFAYGWFDMGGMQGPMHFRGPLANGTLNWTGPARNWTGGHMPFGGHFANGTLNWSGPARNWTNGTMPFWRAGGPEAQNGPGMAFGGRGQWNLSGQNITAWQQKRNETAKENFDLMSAIMNGNFGEAQNISEEYGIGPAWLANNTLLSLQSRMHTAMQNGDYNAYTALAGQWRDQMAGGNGTNGRGYGMMGGFFGRGFAHGEFTRRPMPGGN